MKTHTLKHLSLAIGMALAGTASAGTIDFTGSNIYIKFLDGDRLTEANNSIDTNSGGDQGQFSELELRMHATISPQVEAGALYKVAARPPTGVNLVSMAKTIRPCHSLTKNS